MKLTKTQLKRMIKEELLSEGLYGNAAMQQRLRMANEITSLHREGEKLLRQIQDVVKMPDSDAKISEMDDILKKQSELIKKQNELMRRLRG
tara:strand:+ start:652 stop:924 length:273 start_codon:yes stop_codon:yes gene_type:complete